MDALDGFKSLIISQAQIGVGIPIVVPIIIIHQSTMTYLLDSKRAFPRLQWCNLSWTITAPIKSILTE